MIRGVTVAAVVVVGWAVAILLLYLGLLMALRYRYEPSPTFAGIHYPTIAGIMLYFGAALIPVAPAVGAKLSAGYGWTVAAWILGVLAAVVGVILAAWLILGATA